MSETFLDKKGVFRLIADLSKETVFPAINRKIAAARQDPEVALDDWDVWRLTDIAELSRLAITDVLLIEAEDGELTSEMVKQTFGLDNIIR